MKPAEFSFSKRWTLNSLVHEAFKGLAMTWGYRQSPSPFGTIRYLTGFVKGQGVSLIP